MKSGAYYSNIKFNGATYPHIMCVPCCIVRHQFDMSVISSHSSSDTDQKSRCEEKNDSSTMPWRDLEFEHFRDRK